MTKKKKEEEEDKGPRYSRRTPDPSPLSAEISSVRDPGQNFVSPFFFFFLNQNQKKIRGLPDRGGLDR